MSAQLSLAYRSEGSDKSSPTRQDKCLPIKEEAQDLEVLLSSSAMAASHCVLLAFLSVVLLVEAGVVRDEPETRIIGGKEIEYSEAPWMAFLLMTDPVNGEEFECGGSIIHEDWVLTAAHCTEPYDRRDLELRIGSKSSDSGGMLFYVQRVVEHDDYRKYKNDISLLMTDAPMPLGNTVKPIRLPAPRSRPKIGTEVTVAGWGRKDDGKASKWLRAVVIETRPISDCRSLRPDEATQICAGLSGQDSCHGDSGGPLVDGDVIVGIVSYGDSGKCALNPSIYTDVGAYVHWIGRYVPV